MKMRFEWDIQKNNENLNKHGVSFERAQNAFFDRARIIHKDEKHSGDEERYFLFGFDGIGIITVRFTMRKDCIRIFGAGYWRKGKEIYENG